MLQMFSCTMLHRDIAGAAKTDGGDKVRMQAGSTVLEGARCIATRCICMPPQASEFATHLIWPHVLIMQQVTFTATTQLFVHKKQRQRHI